MVGELAVEDLLDRRGEIGKTLFERTASKAQEIGLALQMVIVKDIMFPGKLKNIFAQVVNPNKLTSREYDYLARAYDPGQNCLPYTCSTGAHFITPRENAPLCSSGVPGCSGDSTGHCNRSPFARRSCETPA